MTPPLFVLPKKAYVALLGSLLASSSTWAAELPYLSLLGSSMGGPDNAGTFNNCRFESGGTSRALFNLPTQLNVSPSTPTGTVLYQTSATGAQFRVTCPGQHQSSYGYTTPMNFHSSPQTYRTNVPGIGIQVIWRESGPAGSISGYMGWPRQVNSRSPGRYHITSRYEIKLIRLAGDLTGPLRLSSPLTSLGLTPITAAELVPSRTSVPIVSPNPTCSVNAGSKLISVFLGDHPRRNFNGVNFTTPEQPFKITLNCSGGASGGSTNVRFSITDAHFPDNRTQALRLSPGAGASGVGIRIQRYLNGVPSTVTLGSVQTAGTVFPGVSRHEINLSAQYIQQVPASQIREGLAPGRARFTITYN
ncbi:type 1 fimbrial protein [Pseudomonas tructae]|uniref:Type 1 fimbrial protein n=1 Tax=Pseudomonas tructae TaxID=2518644 RepID=A0A411MGJ8_9PSED|nr:fimbrial protein [Pseudomonas tructae]QBF25955.1 type 1 fimbrial protein [Pseudomonas tructae]